MTIKELIAELEKVENKDLPVTYGYYDLDQECVDEVATVQHDENLLYRDANSTYTRGEAITLW